MSEARGRSPGRPRDAAIDRAIGAAALALLRKRPYAQVGMRAIAASAGVSRQALYRRFASKQEALLAALVAAGQEQIVVRPTGSLDRDLARFLTKTFSALRRVEAPMRALVAQAQMDRASRTALRERLIASRRDALRTLLEHHLRGDDPVRIDLLIDIAFGVMWYRFLIGHAPLSPALARDLAALIAGSS